MKITDSPEIKLSVSGGAVKFSAADGWSAEFIGADFPQLIDDSLTIHTPLNDTKAVLSFKCSKNGTVTEKDCTLKIKGKYDSCGKKPNVIPEPAQWHGTGGSFKNISTFSCTDTLTDTAQSFADELSKIINRKIERSDNGDVRFSIDSTLSYLGDEGYEIVCDGKSIKVSSSTYIGAVWAGKTICQLMAQGGFPNGIMRDYPRYSVRGFMLDAARKPVSMAMLEKIVDSMAWYKMNDFQVHLSDNFIWLEHYSENGDESTFDAYQAFRLESALKNDKGETPTASDYSYSKEEFRSFIINSLKKGVRITPEIDMPAHALSFTKVFPEFAVTGETSPLMKKRPLTDHINVRKPEAIEFIKNIFDEYTKGDDPVFPAGTTVHIGADEFLSDYGAYRRFINEFVPYLKKTNPVRLWGGLTWIKDDPETPIIKEAIDNVEMNLWSKDWADGKEMYDMGFKIINTIDHLLYMVPNGTGIRAPYMDFINKSKVFRNFEANRVRLKKGNYIDLPAGSKQVIGGCYAIWNDNIDKRAKGITEQDIYDRFADCAALMAEKTWGSCTDKKNARKIDSAAAAINGNLTNTEKNSRFKAADDIALTGGCSFVETGCHHLNTGSSVHMTIKFDEVLPGQILMEADAPYGSYDIRITENGKLGYTAEGYTYEFNYTPVPNKILNISIETKPLRTVLKTGMFGKKKAEGSFSFNGCLRCKNIKNSSLNIPVQRIGSATNSVKAHIYKISVKQQI